MQKNGALVKMRLLMNNCHNKAFSRFSPGGRFIFPFKYNTPQPSKKLQIFDLFF